MPDVVIIGAGAAGLAAARALHEADLSVVVLEARERIGGRIFTHRDRQTPVAIELGAEFVHGSAPDLTEVLDTASLASIDVAGRQWHASGDKLRPLDDFWERLDAVMKRLDGARQPDRSFQQFLDRKPGGRRLAGERRLALQFVEGFHAADPSLISANALAEGGSPRGDLRERRLARVIEGYDRVTEWLAGPIGDSVRTSAIATRVRWAPGNVAVEAQHVDGRSRPAVQAKAAVIAVPLGVLKAPTGETGAIEFDPVIRQKQPILDKLAVGSVVRITMRLDERFWASDWYARQTKRQGLDTLSFLHTTDDSFPTWWTVYPVRAPVVVAWCGGPRARDVAQFASEQIEDLAIESLGRQLSIPARRLRGMVQGAWMHDWEHDPFSRGAYSYQAVGGAEAPGQLARALRGTLFFAGEATDTKGASGTVHGAIASGRRAAKEIIGVLQSR